MKLGLRGSSAVEGARLEADDRAHAGGRIGVVIVTGSCCIPGMAPFDQEAERRVREAIETTGVDALVRVVPATAAMGGAVPRAAMLEIIERFQRSGRVPLPAVFVNGEAVGSGVPDGAALADILRRVSRTQRGGT